MPEKVDSFGIDGDLGRDLLDERFNVSGIIDFTLIEITARG